MISLFQSINILSYIPQTITVKHNSDTTYLIRKRILHSGWQVSYSYTDQDYWTLLVNVASKQDALNVINNHRR